MQGRLWISGCSQTLLFWTAYRIMIVLWPSHEFANSPVDGNMTRTVQNNRVFSLELGEMRTADSRGDFLPAGRQACSFSHCEQSEAIQTTSSRGDSFAFGRCLLGDSLGFPPPVATGYRLQATSYSLWHISQGRYTLWASQINNHN